MDEFQPREDPELERKLEATFAGIRPRPGFVDELRGRLQRHQPWWEQLGFRGGLPPKVWPVLGGVAAVLVVVLLLAPVLAPRVSTMSAPQPALAPERSAASVAPSPTPLAFGKLPAPALALPVAAGAPGVAPALVDAGVHNSSGLIPYYGPAVMTVTAPVPEPPQTLNVFRWTEPSPGDLVQAQQTYGGAVVSGSAAGREPLVEITQGGNARGTPPAKDAAVQLSDRFLASRRLTPSWLYQIQEADQNGLAEVGYVRQFLPAPGATVALQVDREGDPAGAVVRMGASGSRVQAAVPLPMEDTQASYRARPARQVKLDALNASPLTAGFLDPPPSVSLSQVRLVYIAVPNGMDGFFEPAHLFTGTFEANGSKYEKRVLVPAIDQSALG